MSPFAPGQIDVLVNVVNDPISAILVGIGTLLIAFSSLLLGYMTLRGIIAGFVPRSGGKQHRQSG